MPVLLEWGLRHGTVSFCLHAAAEVVLQFVEVIVLITWQGACLKLLKQVLVLGHLARWLTFVAMLTTGLMPVGLNLFNVQHLLAVRASAV